MGGWAGRAGRFAVSGRLRHHKSSLFYALLMTSSPWVLLASYSAAIVAASLLGGWLPSVVRMTHTRTQLFMSAVAGLMLGIALYHLLPHGLLQLQRGAAPQAAIERAVWWMMAGMIAMLLLLRSFRFHQHDFSTEAHARHGDHPDVRSDSDSAAPHALSWLGIALGLGLHTLLDGVALGASIASGFLHSDAAAGAAAAVAGDAVNSATASAAVVDGATAAANSAVNGGADSAMHGAAGLAGLGVFLAILLHKPLDALSITSLMKSGGWSARWRMAVNAGFALLCPLGALLFFLGVNQSGVEQAYAVGAALAFAAGVFLCIALGDLLPEVHFHRHDRVKLTLAFLLGIALAYALRHFEPAFLHPPP